MPEHTGRKSIPKCLEHNKCLEAATVDLLKANLFFWVAALVDKRKEIDATYLYFGKAFYIFLYVLVLFYLYKCADLLAKVLLNVLRKCVRMVRNIEVKRVADTMKIKIRFFNSAQYIREIIRSKMSNRKFTQSSTKNWEKFASTECNVTKKKMGQGLVHLSNVSKQTKPTKSPDGLAKKGNVVLGCVNLSIV